MNKYKVFLKFTDRCFFEGEAESKEEAIKYAEETVIGNFIHNDEYKYTRWSILDVKKLKWSVSNMTPSVQPEDVH
jgi:hypothetical protein